MLLGVIADDFTGGTDIAGFLVENGMRTIQLSGTPASDSPIDADAVVISLKSRSCAAQKAVDDSVEALHWLKKQGCSQFYFKYCSTFDSTTSGNIGPVTDALLEELGEDFTIVCPALPVNGRTVFNGHLFVFTSPLNESGMRNHPVTPMTDSSLIRLMDQQSKGQSGLVPYTVVGEGPQKVLEAYNALKQAGKRYGIVDAITASHLETLGASAKNLTLVTGGSGLAIGIAKNWAASLSDQTSAKERGRPSAGKTVILSGSCSEMTNKQVSNYCKEAPCFAVDVESCSTASDYAKSACQWVLRNIGSPYAPMITATVSPHALHEIQKKYGAEASCSAVETFFYELAALLKKEGVTNFIVAGGETSGAVTHSLNIDGFHIGPQIAPGVPWVTSLDGTVSLALKSGNFGDPHFFRTAQSFLP